MVLRRFHWNNINNYRFHLFWKVNWNQPVMYTSTIKHENTWNLRSIRTGPMSESRARRNICSVFFRENSVRRKMSQREEIYFSDKSQPLILDNVEHIFPDERIYSILTFTKWFSCVLILLTNVPLLVFILRQASKSFLDWMIVIDCLLCLSNIQSILLDGLRGNLRILLTLLSQAI